MACALCGFVRTTEDVDILISREQSNISALLRVLERFGEGHARELTVADFTDEEGCIRIVEDFPLDVFVRMGGRTYEDFLPQRAFHEVAGTKIPYLDAHGLILLKQDSHRDKDRSDVDAPRFFCKEVFELNDCDKLLNVVTSVSEWLIEFRVLQSTRSRS